MVRTATIGQEVKESDRNDQHCKQLIIQTQTNRTKQKKLWQLFVIGKMQPRLSQVHGRIKAMVKASDDEWSQIGLNAQTWRSLSPTGLRAGWKCNVYWTITTKQVISTDLTFHPYHTLQSTTLIGDGFYRSKDPTNSIKVLKEQIVHRQIKHTISRHEHKTQQVP